MMQADLTGATSAKEAVDILKKHENVEKGQWLIGSGWDQDLFPGKQFPTRFDLDDTFPTLPVLLFRRDYHAAWVNTALLRVVGKLPDGDLEGGKILRDKNGASAGIFIDKAIEFVKRHCPLPTQEIVEHWIEAAVKECAKFGITSVHDAGMGRRSLDAVRSIAKRDALLIRIYAMVDSGGYIDVLPEEGVDIFALWKKSGLIEDDLDGHLTVRAAKLFMDGALGSRGAALTLPYCDDTAHNGIVLMSNEHLRKEVLQWMGAGFQVCTHAIGDRANFLTLNAYEEALSSLRGKDVRPRIEHAQIVLPDDQKRYALHNVIASMQPTHCTSDMPYAEERLGLERVRYAYTWNSFCKAGVKVAFGSDFPVEKVNPLLGFYSAITRQDHSEQPKGGWQPHEIVSREQALRSFTLDAAYAAFQENELGSIEVSKRADFIILSDDIMRIPVKEILNVRVLATFVGGFEVYSSN